MATMFDSSSATFRVAAAFVTSYLYHWPRLDSAARVSGR